MSKKKKKAKANSKTTKPRPVRLQLAKTWMASYKGKNMVWGYAKHFRVDLLCAIMDLRLLGVEVAAEYETNVRRAISGRAALKKRKADTQKEADNLYDLQDNEFSLIAGYTSGGASYGSGWEDTPFYDTETYGF